MNLLINTVDIIVIVLVSVLCIAIAAYLYFSYRNNPCGNCSEAKRCSKNKKRQPNWVKAYHKCYSKNKIKNIFIDFNGTILDDTDLCYEILCEMTDKANLKRVSMHEYKEAFDFPVINYYKKVGFDFDKVDYHDISSYFFSNYLKRWPTETKIFDNFVSTIEKLKNQGFKVYIITASEEKLLLDQLEHFKILNLFDGYVASKDIKANGKVENARMFMNENKINPKETIMFGDTVHDALVAKELGIKCILFSKGHNTKKKLKSTNNKVVRSYNELYKELTK